MSDFLTRLAERQLGGAGGVAPRLPSRFAAPVPPEMEPEPSPSSVRSTPPERAQQPRSVGWATDVEAPPKLAPRLDIDPSAVAVPSRPPARRAVTHEVERHAEHRNASVERPLPQPIVTAPQIAPGQPTLDHEPLAPIVVIDRQTSSAVRTTPPVPPPLLLPQARLGPRLKAERRLEAPSSTNAAPVVNVTIGRVEVRAVVPPPPARERRRTAAPKALSLEEYLERRHGARR